MDLALTLRSLKRRWWVVAVALLVTLTLAFVTTPANPRSATIRSFTATHTLLQGASTVTGGGSGANSSGINYPRLILFATTGDIPVRVAEKLDFPGEPAVLAARVRVTNDPSTQTLRVRVDGDDGEEDARIANAFAEEILLFLRQSAVDNRNAAIEAAQAQVTAISAQVVALPAGDDDPLVNAQRAAQLSRYQTAFQQLQDLESRPPAAAPLTTLESAVPVPVVSTGFTAPSSRSGRLLVGLVLGLLLGLATVLGMERLDTRLRTREVVEEVTRLPVLTEVPLLPRGQRRRRSVEVFEHPEGAVAEAYRTLRASVQLMPSGSLDEGATLLERARRGPQVIMVTSAAPGEGKTTLAVNLAAALAEAGHEVLLLDCDFRSPTVAAHFGLPRSPGLSEAVADPRITLESLVQTTRVPGVKVVQAGTGTSPPGSLTARLGPLVAQARTLAGFVVLDTAPVLTTSEAADLAPWVDTSLLVVRAGRTGRELAVRTTERLERLGAAVAGAALVGVRVSASPYPHYPAVRPAERSEETSGPRHRRRRGGPKEDIFS